jgi:hypothetical protein
MARILLSIVLLFVPVTGALAQGRRLSASEKCEIYRVAWGSVSASSKSPLSESFVQANTEFLKGGCVEYAAVCPRTEADFAAANRLTVLTMNKGMASTFVPFRCP